MADFFKNYIWLILASVAAVIFFIVSIRRRLSPLMQQERMNRELEEKYAHIDIEKIDSASDDILWRAVLMSVWAKMKDDMSDEWEIFSALSENKKAVYAINKLETEIGERGMEIFYLTRGRRFAEKAPEYYRAVGLNKRSDIMQRANEIFEQHRELFEKGEQLPMSEQYYFDDIQDEWDDAYSDEEIAQACVKFIRSNKGDMVG